MLAAADLDPEMTQAVHRLVALPVLLPAPEASFEQRVWQRVRAAQQPADRRPRPGRAWPAVFGHLRWGLLAPLAVVLVLLLALLPGPRAAVGNWMARIRLGKLDLVLAPEPTARPTLVANTLDFGSLDEAENVVGFHLLSPGVVPAGFELTGIQSVSYDQLPAWLQPLYVESVYRSSGGEPDQDAARLRQYNARQAGGVQIGEIEYQSEDVQAARRLTLAQGAPAVLLVFRDRTPPLRELVWEHDGMTFELWSAVWTEDEMIRVAESLK